MAAPHPWPGTPLTVGSPDLPTNMPSCRRSRLQLANSEPRPHFTILVRVDNGTPIDTALSPATLAFLSQHNSTLDGAADQGRPVAAAADLPSALVPSGREIALEFDSAFFHLINQDLDSLSRIQAGQEREMEKVIVALGHEIAQVTRPAKFRKSDMSPWRHIFELYVDAQIFFSTTERDGCGARDSTRAKSQLAWFQSEVEKRGLPSRFKLRGSRDAFAAFQALNASLLRHVRFQELNRTALTKILKSLSHASPLPRPCFYPSLPYPLPRPSAFKVAKLRRHRV